MEKKYKHFGRPILFLLLILFGALVLTGCEQKSEQTFELSTAEMLSVVLNEKYAVSPEEGRELLNQSADQYQLVDLRAPVEFAEGHLPGAVNVPAPQLLGVTFLEDLRNSGMTYLLYGQDQLEANGPWMILRQLGFENVKVLQGGYAYLSAAESDSVPGYEAEKPQYDYLAVYEKAVKEHEAAVEAGKVKAPPPPPPKKIVPKKKKKVEAEEEGC